MINILISNPLFNSKDAFWNKIEPVSTDTLISLYGKDDRQSWSYNGNDVIFLPEMPVADVLEFMQIHKLFKNIPDSFHKTHAHIMGDMFGLVTQAINPYKVTYLDDVDNTYIANINIVKDYVLKDEEIINKVIILNDHVETLYELNIDFTEAYMLTREADILTLCALDYMLKGLSATIDADYYFNITKIITCEQYTLIKTERIMTPCLL